MFCIGDKVVVLRELGFPSRERPDTVEVSEHPHIGVISRRLSGDRFDYVVTVFGNEFLVTEGELQLVN